MKDNYFKQKKKFERLNKKNKEKTQAQKYNKLTCEMISEFNRQSLQNSLELKHKTQNKTQLLTTKVLEKEG